MSSDNDNLERDYSMLRLPRREYDRVIAARDQYRRSENLNQNAIGSLALGAFVGFLAGLAINELANNRAARRRPQARRRRNT